MKESELMIGNFLRYKQDFPFVLLQGKIVKVCGIDGRVDVRTIDDGKFHESEHPNWLEPIPLTPEILEKNGWEHEFDKIEYMVKYDLAQKGKNCWMMWAIKEHNLDIQRQDEKLDMYNLKVQRVCIPCDYVHQLQNAFRLCEIEHEITL